jgi:hypothetical protein
VAQEVAQAGDLGSCLVADDDVLVAASPDLLFPAVDASDFLGEVTVQVAGEGGELLV